MVEVSEYCREVEAYLCRKNEGHLIRIAGPVFEQVSGWAGQGVPLTVVYRGIDRYCERYYAKGPKRRPVRVEFCEPDILELFDDWRRAVGVAQLSEPSADAAGSAKRDPLPSHLERAIARLTGLRAAHLPAGLSIRIEETARELDRMRTAARDARGEARSALLARLSALDDELIQAARAGIDEARSAALAAEAEAEIAPFAARMAAPARTHASEAAFNRLLRDSLGLPVLSYEP